MAYVAGQVVDGAGEVGRENAAEVDGDFAALPWSEVADVPDEALGFVGGGVGDAIEGEARGDDRADGGGGRGFTADVGVLDGEGVIAVVVDVAGDAADFDGETRGGCPS